MKKIIFGICFCFLFFILPAFAADRVTITVSCFVEGEPAEGAVFKAGDVTAKVGADGKAYLDVEPGDYVITGTYPGISIIPMEIGAYGNAAVEAKHTVDVKPTEPGTKPEQPSEPGTNPTDPGTRPTNPNTPSKRTPSGGTADDEEPEGVWIDDEMVPLGLPFTGIRLRPLFIMGGFAGLSLVLFLVFRKKRWKYGFLFAFGLFLGGCAGFGIYVSEEDVAAGEAAERILEAIPDAGIGYEDGIPVAVVEDSPYVGVIEIPELSIRLPVSSRVTEESLTECPGRYVRHPGESGFVICGHSYIRHFRPIRTLEAGAEIIFTDVAGKEYRYAVTGTEIVDPDDVLTMADPGYDLTLFTCTKDQTARFAVRCVRSDPA